jgi:hypothetical protein
VSLRLVNKLIKVTTSLAQIGLLATNEAALALVRRFSAFVELMLYTPKLEAHCYSNPRRQLLSTISDRERLEPTVFIMINSS